MFHVKQCHIQAALTPEESKNNAKRYKIENEQGSPFFLLSNKSTSKCDKKCERHRKKLSKIFKSSTFFTIISDFYAQNTRLGCFYKKRAFSDLTLFQGDIFRIFCAGRGKNVAFLRFFAKFWCFFDVLSLSDIKTSTFEQKTDVLQGCKVRFLSEHGFGCF